MIKRFDNFILEKSDLPLYRDAINDIFIDLIDKNIPIGSGYISSRNFKVFIGWNMRGVKGFSLFDNDFYDCIIRTIDYMRIEGYNLSRITITSPSLPYMNYDIKYSDLNEFKGVNINNISLDFNF